MMLKLAPILLCAISTVALNQTIALAQTGFNDNTERTLRCEDNSRDTNRFQSCEVREQNMASTGSLHINAGVNGGVTVKGWNQPGVLVRSKIEAWSDSLAGSKSLMSAVQVQAGGGSVAATGPKIDGDSGWSVSYEVFVPHTTDLELQAHNGGVHVIDVGGTMNLHTVNGGLHLARLAGAVTAVTVNGGVHVELMGDHWDGRGLEATSTNGGVHVVVPQSYSAQIEGTTVNGKISSEFQELSISGTSNRSQPQLIAASLGHGGALIHLATTNGGLTIARQ